MIDGTLRQEFETGWFELDDAGQVIWTVASEDQLALPEAKQIAGRVVRQNDATAWFVTRDLRRKWIPDGRTWDCLGGWDEVALSEIPGYVIAQLEYGGLATCKDTQVGTLNLIDR